jgi:hypothetical protein
MSKEIGQLGRAAFIFMFLGSSALAQDAASDALNELSDEMLKCAGFYAIMDHCLTGPADVEMKKNIEQHRTNLITGASSLAGRIGLLPATSEARAELHMKDFTKRIAGDCRNIAILLNEIGGNCRTLASDPMPRFKELLNEKQAAYGRAKPR